MIWINDHLCDRVDGTSEAVEGGSAADVQFAGNQRVSAANTVGSRYDPVPGNYTATADETKFVEDSYDKGIVAYITYFAAYYAFLDPVKSS